MSLFLDEFKDFLVSNTSLTFGTDLFIGGIPEKLNLIVNIQEATSPQEIFTNDGDSHEVFNIQFQIRGNKDYRDGANLANDVTDPIRLLGSEDLPNFIIINGMFGSQIVQVGVDSNNNYLYSGLYEARIERK